MTDSILKESIQKFDGAIEHLNNELSTIRTGRANPTLLSTVMVESYGSKLPLNQVANITVSDAKTLTITPWDKSQIQEIEKGIMSANLGFNPSNDGVNIRVILPPMTEERRKEMVKLANQIGEQSRIQVRQIREDAIKSLKKLESDNSASKDEVANAQKELQDSVNLYNEKIKTITSDKEKEIMTI